VWRLNPHAYRHLAPLGKFVGIPFLVLSALLALTAVGWFKRRFWGWLLAVAVIATQVLGDVVRIASGLDVRQKKRMNVGIVRSAASGTRIIAIR
jgi:hypothetical protein